MHKKFFIGFIKTQTGFKWMKVVGENCRQLGVKLIVDAVNELRCATK